MDMKSGGHSRSESKGLDVEHKVNMKKVQENMIKAKDKKKNRPSSVAKGHGLRSSTGDLGVILDRDWEGDLKKREPYTKGLGNCGNTWATELRSTSKNLNAKKSHPSYRKDLDKSGLGNDKYSRTYGTHSNVNLGTDLTMTTKS